MCTEIKPIGMIHIKGVNDKQYAEYKKKLQSKTKESNYMVSIVKNRW